MESSISSLKTIFISVSFLFLLTPNARGQITPDNTLGRESSRVTPNVQIRGFNSDRIDGGARRGVNLFHSFSEFNIDAGRAAYFSNPAGVRNILTRVTGGNRSNIFGTLGVDGAANLYLINPNGIFFGNGASLDIRGSFTATTADGISLGTTGSFSALNPGGDNLIEVEPGALFHNAIRTTPSEITVDGADLSSSTEAITIDTDSLIVTNGGRISRDISREGIGGDITIDTGTLSLTNGGIISVSTFGPGNAGSLNITASNDIEINNGQIFGDTEGSGIGGDINIETGSLRVTNGGFISTSTFGIGNSGNLNIEASNITIDGLDSSLFADTSSDSSGTGGSINIRTGPTGSLTVTNGGQINADTNSLQLDPLKPDSGVGGTINIDTGTLRLTNGGIISVSTFGPGNAGSLIITAENININGERSAIFANTEGSGFANTFGDLGKGGDITIDTGALTLTDGGFITTGTFGPGNAGTLTVRAENINIDDVNIDGVNIDRVRSGLLARTNSSEIDAGVGGSIDIRTGTLSVINGGQITVSTFGPGNAGSLNIEASNINIDGVNINGQSSAIFANTSGSGFANTLGDLGRGGDITIETASLTLTNSGRISITTFGPGNAGFLTVRASNINIDGQGSAIFANTEGSGFANTNGNSGRGGDINIDTRTLNLTNGGEINVSTFGPGNAGFLNIEASNITIDGLGSSLFADTSEQSSGRGGNIDIRTGPTGSLSVTNGGQINADTNSLQLNADVGGNINIETGTLRVTNGGQINAGTFGPGDAGSLFVEAENIAIDNGSIFADTSDNSSGRGGNINISTGPTGSLSVTNGGQINADTNSLQLDPLKPDSGVGGSIDIRTGTLTLTSDGQILTRTFGPGNAGNLTIGAQNIEINSGNIFADTFGSGLGGNINISTGPTGSLSVTNGGRIDAEVLSSEPRASGGIITIDTGALTLTDGGQINLNTVGPGNGGNIDIDSGSIELSGVNPSDPTSVSGIFSVTGGEGNAGKIAIVNRDSLRLVDGAQINTSTVGPGNGGNIDIASGSIELSGVNRFDPEVFSAIVSITLGQGNAGNVTIVNRDSLRLVDGGVISTTTLGPGKGGNIEIHSGSIELSGVNPFDPTLPNVIGTGTTGSGNAGNIKINNRNSLRVVDGGTINTSTEDSSGNAGNIEIHSGSIELSGVNPLDRDVLSLASTARVVNGTEVRGNSGNITLSADDIRIENQGGIGVTNRGTGSTGDIKIHANSLALDDGQINAESSNVTGGDINITLARILTLRNESSISTSGIPGGIGNGGDINITVPLIFGFPRNNEIIAQSDAGSGGNININASGIFGYPQFLTIDASSNLGLDGNINFINLDEELTRGEIPLPETPVDAEDILARDICEYKNDAIAGGSSFTAIGKGGIALNPREAVETNRSILEWNEIPNQTSSRNRLSETEAEQTVVWWQNKDDKSFSPVNIELERILDILSLYSSCQ